ncbi:UDP-glucosyltransferase 2-like [Anticarsia gemmatalis]|uniref:UDP-glucosyltransferase 2-like n=1 Tax=Anticarsia gemmatalis TaxID=129554 RepID=UPI003F769612
MKLFLLLLALVSSTFGYNILGLFPVPSHSHNQLGRGIVNALLNEGHSVTWVTPFPEKVGKNPPKTLKIIDVSPIAKMVQGVNMASPETLQRGLSFVKEFAHNITTATLSNKDVIDTLVNTQFDAVVTEFFFNDVMCGVAAVQQVPWIMMTGTQMMPFQETQVDEVRSISTVPLMFNNAGIPMSFVERAANAFIYAAMSVGDWLDRSWTIGEYNKIFGPLAKARGFELPAFDDAFHNVSILLLNAHESLSPPFSMPPNVINIAGFHNDEDPPPLPKDLQELLDNSKQGVIYFSMGSVLRSAALEDQTRKDLLAKFAKLPYTVLWKFEENIPEKLPPNVHVRPWMPQPSILAHPNVKVFITHGGQLSTLEAVATGVPLLAVPVFGDQPANAERAVKSGYALRVTFKPDMAEELDQNLREILKNPAYTERVKYLSKLFKGRPVRPSKLAAHYINLAIETKGAYHLRSLSLQYSWYQRWLLDLAVAVLAALAIVLILLKVALTMCYRKIFGKPSQFDKKKDSKKKRS